MTKYLDETGLAYFWCKIKAHITTAITAIGKVPVGGTAGQVLKKNSNVDFDTSWLTLGEAAVLSVADIEDELGLGTAAYHNHGDYYATADSRTKNTVLAAPSSADGAATFRKLVAADIPSLAISKITDLQTTLDGKADDSDLDALLPKQPGSADLPAASTSNTLFPLMLGNTFANSGKVSYLTKANFQTWLGWDDKADASALSSYATLAANTFTGIQTLKDGSINRDGSAPSADDWGDRYLCYHDKDGEVIADWRCVQRASNNRLESVFRCWREANGSAAENRITVGVNADGTAYYWMSDNAAFRSALGLGTAATHDHGDYYSSSASRTANTVLAAPNNSAGAATFRKLVAADIPNLNASKITAGVLPTVRQAYVLYNNGTGTTGNVTCVQPSGTTAESFKCIDIYYRDNDRNYNTTRVWGVYSNSGFSQIVSGTNAVLQICTYVAGTMWIKMRRVDIGVTGNSITITNTYTHGQTSGAVAGYVGCSASGNEVGATNQIYIEKVVGWV